MKTVECDGDSFRCVHIFQVYADRPGPYFCTPDCKAHYLLLKRSLAVAEALAAENARKRLVNSCVKAEEKRLGEFNDTPEYDTANDHGDES